MRKNMDKGKSCAALLTDLRKTFDCIVRNFLIAILEACFSYEDFEVTYIYLTDRKHRTKVTILSVILLIYCWMSHKVQFYTLFYSTFTSVIFSFLLKEIMLLAMLMTQLHIQTVKIL